MKTKNVKLIDVQDFDELVTKTYGKIYSFQQQDDCKDRGIHYIEVPCHPDDYENDTIPEIINGNVKGVSFKSWLERDITNPLNPSKEELHRCGYYWEEDVKKWCSSKSHLNLFWERNFYPHVSMILNDLHSKGLIKSGKYGINIDW